ncbi:hypothetical protein H0H93_004147 [Arthromyces matolae]|nr:hypothetical protein H0H93_004147 [Arthromyces matolae]
MTLNFLSLVEQAHHDKVDDESVKSLGVATRTELKRHEEVVSTQCVGGLGAERHGDVFAVPIKGSRNAHRHEKRAAERRLQVEKNGHLPSQRTLEEVVQLADTYPTSFSVSTLKVPRGAYTALPKRSLPGGIPDRKKEYGVDELVSDHGFTEVYWNGREPMVLTDGEGNIWGVLAGKPSDPSFMKSADDALAFIIEKSKQAGLGEHADEHLRGDYPAFNVGYTYGNGGQAPSLRDNGRFNGMLQDIMQNPNVERLLTYASASFQLWAPRLYQYYKEHMKSLYELLNVPPFFPRSVYPSAAFNLGGRVRTYVHRDTMNLPFGWCCVLALGNFDPDVSAKLILWDAKLIIRFPHGSTIFLPSASITHSNSPIQAGDYRISITQYAPGGLFRWVDNGGRTEKELKAEDPELYEKMQSEKETRWKYGMTLLPTWKECQDRV